MTELILTVGLVVIVVLVVALDGPRRAHAEHEGQVTQLIVDEGLTEDEARDAVWERQQW